MNVENLVEIIPTNPKTFVLLSGKVEFLYRHIDATDHVAIVLSDSCVIKISPYVTHAFNAITDVAMLECNSILDIQADRHKQDVVIP